MIILHTPIGKLKCLFCSIQYKFNLKYITKTTWIQSTQQEIYPKEKQLKSIAPEPDLQ